MSMKKSDYYMLCMVVIASPHLSDTGAVVLCAYAALAAIYWAAKE